MLPRTSPPRIALPGRPPPPSSCTRRSCRPGRPRCRPWSSGCPGRGSLSRWPRSRPRWPAWSGGCSPQGERRACLSVQFASLILLKSKKDFNHLRKTPGKPGPVSRTPGWSRTLRWRRSRGRRGLWRGRSRRWRHSRPRTASSEGTTRGRRSTRARKAEVLITRVRDYLFIFAF